MWKKEPSKKGGTKGSPRSDEAIRVKCQCLSKNGRNKRPMGKDAFVIVTAIHLATLLSSDSVSECAGETVRRENRRALQLPRQRVTQQTAIPTLRTHAEVRMRFISPFLLQLFSHPTLYCVVHLLGTPSRGQLSTCLWDRVERKGMCTRRYDEEVDIKGRGFVHKYKHQKTSCCLVLA